MKSIKLNNLEELGEVVKEKTEPKTKKKKVVHVEAAPAPQGKKRILNVKGGLKIFRNS